MPLPPKCSRSSKGLPTPTPPLAAAAAAAAAAATGSARYFSRRAGVSETAAQHHRHQQQKQVNRSLATVTSTYPTLAQASSFPLRRFPSTSSLAGSSLFLRRGGNGEGIKSSSSSSISSRNATNAAASPSPSGEGAQASAEDGVAAPFPAVSSIDPGAAEREAAIARAAEEGEWENALDLLQSIRFVHEICVRCEDRDG